MENEGHLGELNNWVTNLDTALENQHYDLEDKATTIGDNQIQITLLESNVTKLDQRFVKSGVQLNNFKHNINHKTEHILKKEQNLEKVVSQVKKESANFTAMIDTVSSEVNSHHAAFEKGLKTASTSAAYAKQKAEHAQNQLATYVKRTNRANQTLFGKINRQNDLLAYLMNKVQKLEQTLQDRTNVAPTPTSKPVKTVAASLTTTTTN
jgi:chromosome segregation ATPase